MSVSINTKDYVKGKKIQLDGMDWEYYAPGAGITLDLSKASRKSAELEKKVLSGKATDEDRKEQEKLVELVFEFYNATLKDGTKDNKHVKKWLRETPMDVVSLVIQEIQKQSE